MPFVLRVLAIAALSVSLLWSAARASADDYQIPVQGDVTDVFRPPATPYGAGNRGWEFDTTAGENVRAANGGTVTFAGQVGGVLNVVVRHSDGLLTTYSRLQSIGVVVGQILSGGQTLGTASHDTYFGVRENGQYIDPASIFDGEPYLVPSAGTNLSTSPAPPRPSISRPPADPAASSPLAQSQMTQAEVDWLRAEVPAYWPSLRAQAVELHL